MRSCQGITCSAAAVLVACLLLPTATEAAGGAVVGGEPPPHVAYLLVEAGTAGTVVPVIGTGLAHASTVQFGDVPASFTIETPESISAVAPPNTGTVYVTVTTPQGTSPTDFGDEFSYLAPTAMPSPAPALESPASPPAVAAQAPAPAPSVTPLQRLRPASKARRLRGCRPRARRSCKAAKRRRRAARRR